MEIKAPLEPVDRMIKTKRLNRIIYTTFCFNNNLSNKTNKGNIIRAANSFGSAPPSAVRPSGRSCDISGLKTYMYKNTANPL